MRTTWAVLFLNTVTAWTMCWEASIVIVKESSEMLGAVAGLDGFGPPAGLSFSSRRDKRGMSWFVKTRKPIVQDRISDNLIDA